MAVVRMSVCFCNGWVSHASEWTTKQQQTAALHGPHYVNQPLPTARLAEEYPRCGIVLSTQTLLAPQACRSRQACDTTVESYVVKKRAMMSCVAQLRPHAVPRRAHGTAHDPHSVAALALPGTGPAGRCSRRGRRWRRERRVAAIALTRAWRGGFRRRLAAARRLQAGRSSASGDPSEWTTGRALRVRPGAISMHGRTLNPNPYGHCAGHRAAWAARSG
jgi:hypothetical protein